jgi:hypothetical protein
VLGLRVGADTGIEIRGTALDVHDDGVGIGARAGAAGECAESAEQEKKGGRA